MSTPWIVAYVVLAGLVVLLALLVVGLMRRVVPVVERSEEVLASATKQLTIGGLAPGAAVPHFHGTDLSGEPVTEADLRGATSIVLFVDKACAACEMFVEDLRSSNVPTDLGARLIVVSRDPEQAESFEMAGVRVIVDDDRLVARAFQSVVSPQAFVVDGYGMALASGTPNTWREVNELIAAARGGGRMADVTAAFVASSDAKEI